MKQKYQIGNKVLDNEIGNLIGLDSKTVESHVQLFDIFGFYSKKVDIFLDSIPKKLYF